MLALEKSLHFIEASEPDVIAVYRSNSAIFMAPEGHERQPCEAYLCVIRKDDQMRIYTAIILGDNKDILVYTLKPENTTSSHPKNLSSTLKFMEEMGFAMEPVNLSYGTALREVVVKSISILRQPGSSSDISAKKVSKPNTKIQELDQGKESADTKGPPAPSQITGEKQKVAVAPGKIVEAPKTSSRPAPKIPPPDAPTEPPDLRAATKSTAATNELPALQQQLSELKTALKAAVSEIGELRGQISELNSAKDEIEQAAANDLTSLQAEWEDLFEKKNASDNAEIERLTAEKDAAEKSALEALAELKAKEELLNGAEKKVEKSTDGTGKEQERFAAIQQELDNSNATIASLRGELAELTITSAAREHQTAEEISALQKELVDMTTVRSAVENSLSLELAKMTTEVERLSVAANAESAAAERLTILEAELALANKEKSAVANTTEETVTALRSELEIISANYAAAVQAKDMELEQLRTSLELANEARQAIEASMADNLTALQKELDESRLQIATLREHEKIAPRATEVKLNPDGTTGELGGELEKMATEKASLELTLSMERAGHQSEIQRLNIERIAAERVAAEELSALKSALARLANEKVAAEQRVFEQLAVGKITADQHAVLKSQPTEMPEIIPPTLAAPSPNEKYQPPSPGTATSSAGNFADRPSLLKTSYERPATALEKKAAPGGKLDKSAMDKAIADLASSGNDISDTSNVIEPVETTPFSSSLDESITFQIDKALTSIHLDSPGELIELHNSINMARINPEGQKIQNCSAYVCVVKKGDTVSVYVALYLTESELNLIYMPSKQPSAAIPHQLIVQEAITFAETVGFMMDVVQLGAVNDKRADLINSLPVFS